MAQIVALQVARARSTSIRGRAIPVSRRTFIKAGAFGTGALLIAGAFGGWRLRRCAADPAALSPATRALFSAMLPAFLDGVIRPEEWTTAGRDAALGQVEATIAALAPSARQELHQLSCLLDQGAFRLLLAGSWASWASVTPTDARRVLERWRSSRMPMLVSAYQALHDITYASWYAQPAHWASTGYPGPPALLGLAS